MKCPKPGCDNEVRQIFRYSGGRDNRNNRGRVFSCEEHGLAYEDCPIDEKYKWTKGKST